MISTLKNKNTITALLVALFTFAVYLPVLRSGFVNWDDQLYVYENLHIRSLDMNFLKWMFSFQDTMWVPLTKLSHAINYALWGLNPAGHHFTNILLHSINTFLVVFLILRLIKMAGDKTPRFMAENAFICAALTGLIFGVHPIHVESVAWVTERKDVLSIFFVLLSLLQYLEFTSVSEAGQRRLAYIMSMIFFSAALLSKPIAVTLPLVLIILDIYPLERLRFKRGELSQIKVLMEKVPFILLSAAAAVTTLLFYKYGGIQVTITEGALTSRLLVSVQTLFFYIYKMLWPVNLAPMYPLSPDVSLFAIKHLLPLILFISFSVFCIYRWKSQKLWLSLWTFYIITLLPVLGIVNFGYFTAADRYTYLPGLAPAFLISVGLTYIYGQTLNNGKLESARKAFMVTIIIIICLISFLTIKQGEIWKSSITLWSAQLEIYPENHLGHMNLATAYGAEGRHSDVLEVLNRAAELYPSDPEIFFNRAVTHGKLGAHQKAVADLKTAVSLHPSAHYYNELGVAYGNLGIYDKAIENLNTALEMDPQMAGAYFFRGIAYKRQGMENLSIQDFRTAAGLGHERAQTYLNSIGIK